MSQSIPPEPKALTTLDFVDAIKLRRSIYSLNDKSTISDAKIEQLVKDSLLHVPSAFNSQSARIVLVVGDAHKKFWEMTAEEHHKAAGGDEEKWKRSAPRLDGFKAAYGSVLFFESEATIKKLQDASPAYAPLFPQWSEHSSGMHQFVLWTTLEAEGFGANLQHYQYVQSVEDRAKEMYDLPSDWVIKAQLVFGGVNEGGRPTEGKEKLDTKDTLKVFGAKD